MKEHITRLTRMHACGEAVAYADGFESLDMAWQACKRGDWMLWLVSKTINCKPWSDGRKPFLACALDCAETVKHLWPEKQAPKIAGGILVLRRWISGEATIEEAQTARRSLYADVAYAAYDDAVVVYAAAAASSTVTAAVPAGVVPAAAAKKLQECARIVTHTLLTFRSGSPGVESRAGWATRVS